jgi:hypothetical protein
MRRFVLLGPLAVVVACVGSDPPPSSGTSGTSGTSDADAGTGAVAAGFSADRSIGCDGKVACTSGQTCCGTGMDWLNVSCAADCGVSYKLQCDDRADCAPGKVCCMITDGGARATDSVCKTSCTGAGEQQLCKLGGEGECLTGTCQHLGAFSPNGLSSCR